MTSLPLENPPFAIQTAQNQVRPHRDFLSCHKGCEQTLSNGARLIIRAAEQDALCDERAEIIITPVPLSLGCERVLVIETKLSNTPITRYQGPDGNYRYRFTTQARHHKPWHLD